MSEVSLKAGACGDAHPAAWVAYREGKTTWIDDDAGHIAAIVPVAVAEGNAVRPLNINQAGYLAELIRAVDGNKRLRYYPIGADGDAPNQVIEIRAFTREDGSMAPYDADIRDTFVWTSGFTEHWFKVSDLLLALENAITGKYGLDKPMAMVEERK